MCDFFVGYSKKIEKLKQTHDIDTDKIKYLEAMLTLLLYAEKCYHENEKVEFCLAFREILKVALQVPDHKLVIAVYKHLGIYNRNTQNYGAAINAF